jgi:mannose-6-phosphate isomerase-like protein (cupin superfamily)
VPHKIVNQGAHDLKLFSIYAPPVYAVDTAHVTKVDAEAGEGASDTG